MNKSDITDNIIEMKPADLILSKASAKFGGGFITTNGESIRKIMLRRSRNYLYDEEKFSQNHLLYDSLSWYVIARDTLNCFSYILFVNFDDVTGKLYPLVFTVEEFKALLKEFNVTQDSINIYIQKSKGINEFKLTRLGAKLGTPKDVSSNYLNWEKLKF